VIPPAVANPDPYSINKVIRVEIRTNIRGRGVQNTKVRNEMMMIMIIIIQFNSCLFTCKLNSTEANYKASTNRKKYTKIIKKTKYKI
jgi:hypothetical protein